MGIKKDFKKMEEQFGRVFNNNPNTLLVILGLAIVLGTSFFAKAFPILTLFIWLGIPTLLFLIKMITSRLNRNIKIISVIITINISGGIFFCKDEVTDYLGYNTINGFYSYYDTVVVERYSGEAATKEEEEVYFFKCNHWTGKLIVEIFRYIFFPLLLVIPYLTWKILML